MTPPDPRELWDAPELAIVFPMLACIDGLVASLTAQHGTLHEEWRKGDPASLVAARALIRDLTKARLAVARYLRTIRGIRRVNPDEPLPF